ncbi:MAG: S-layer homology domain-containing protein [Oscillospiraceae bacterium]
MGDQEQGITTGVGDNLFAPEPALHPRADRDLPVARRRFSRAEGRCVQHRPTWSHGSYYEKAVAWAIENGITTGTTTSTFSPDATCTRAQSVTFLFRAIGKLVDSKAEFSDVLTDSYYANAVAWAVENGVTNGIGDGLFGPDNSCTRAQIVTFLFRAYQGK